MDDRRNYCKIGKDILSAMILYRKLGKYIVSLTEENRV
jgi:hypothetical protein